MYTTGCTDAKGSTLLSAMSGRIAHILAWLCLAISGCKTCQIPRIDPTGNGIFAPGTTTLDPQLGHLPTPTPAFTTPPTPPPCTPGQPGCKKEHLPLSSCTKLVSGIQREFTCVGDEGQLQLTPARLIAPVGTEVVLLAGLCGPDRNFVARQPIEWVLSQDSVGNFVAVGEDGECSVTRVYKSQPKKTTGAYAVGVSSASSETVTRGTPQTTDDFHLGRGQGWLSLTSPSEGTSYVTVLAPKAKNWDQRRQTAVIHWVDAQWSLPSPAIVPAGRKHTLTTVVRRAGGALPATGYLVRYEVTSGEPAGFGPRQQTALEVPVDAQGNASVEVGQLANTAGTSMISIQILRPGLLGASAERIGDGATSITWSAPGLAVKVSGPQVVQAGLEATFRIDVTNPGDIASRDVVVSDTLPPSLTFTGSNPPAQEFGNRREWRLGDIPPRTTRTITLRAMAARGGDIRYTVRARSADGIESQDTFASSVAQQALKVVLSGAQVADVGGQVQIRVEIENAGDQPLSNVQLTNRFDAGLEHAQGERSPLVRGLGDLMPREKKVVGITYIVRQPGKQCLTLDATADGGQLTTAQHCLEAGVRQTSSLTVKKTGPAEQVVGGMADFVIEVTNTGNTPLTNVRIVDQYAASLEPKNASNGYMVEAGALTWMIPQLDPGKFVQRRVNSLCLKADPNAVNLATVTTKEGVTASDQTSTRIVPASGGGFGAPRGANRVEVDKPVNEDEGNTNADGQLTLGITSAADTIRLGTASTYFINLANERTVSDRDVKLRILLSEGLKYNKMSGRYIAHPSADGRVIDITPIVELRAGEKLQEFKLEVVATAPGKQSIRAEVTSQRTPTAITAEAETTIHGK